MQAQARLLDETPVSLGPGTLLETVTVSENDGAAAYFKVYDQATTPTGTDTPVLTFGVEANAVGKQFSVFYQSRATLWVAVSTDALAGLTAVGTDATVSMVHS